MILRNIVQFNTNSILNLAISHATFSGKNILVKNWHDPQEKTALDPFLHLSSFFKFQMYEIILTYFKISLQIILYCFLLPSSSVLTFSYHKHSTSTFFKTWKHTKKEKNKLPIDGKLLKNKEEIGKVLFIPYEIEFAVNRSM